MAKKLAAGLRRWFERMRQRAERLLADPTQLELTAAQAETKARAQGKLRKTWSDVIVLVRLVRAFVRGDYREVSRGTLLIIVGALVYFVSPIDAILDHIPVIGMFDDAAVLAWVVSEVRAEIDAFRNWESERLRAPSADATQPLPMPPDGVA